MRTLHRKKGLLVLDDGRKGNCPKGDPLWLKEVLAIDPRKSQKTLSEERALLMGNFMRYPLKRKGLPVPLSVNYSFATYALTISCSQLEPTLPTGVFVGKCAPGIV